MLQHRKERRCFRGRDCSAARKGRVFEAAGARAKHALGARAARKPQTAARTRRAASDEFVAYIVHAGVEA